MPETLVDTRADPQPLAGFGDDLETKTRARNGRQNIPRTEPKFPCKQIENCEMYGIINGRFSTRDLLTNTPPIQLERLGMQFVSCSGISQYEIGSIFRHKTSTSKYECENGRSTCNASKSKPCLHEIKATASSATRNNARTQYHPSTSFEPCKRAIKLALPRHLSTYLCRQ